MESNRRQFLKIAGLSVLGVGAKPVIDAAAGGSQPGITPHPEALTGKRWGMVIDLREPSAEQYRACIDVCHAIHNVPDMGNAKEEVKWIWGESYEHAFPGQEHKYAEDFVHEGLRGAPVLVLCNHCDNPPCVRVCPTKATFRRSDGVVMMDYHRCIGCRFCMAGCPFGARSMNWRDPRPFIKEINPNFPTRARGVVEKCNFCAERLGVGKMPACVETSHEIAGKRGDKPMLYFGDLEDTDSEVRKLVSSHHSIRRKSNLGTMPQVYYIL